ncbi:AsmA-like C-terminal region-containing protein [Hymenobacter bucti]|uniref:AsmA-like C-terminal region-containing protein n=1 Tax=Hymenobacter bucti TaxID=1844114 RepID=A0ABW4QX40_9BACT
MKSFSLRRWLAIGFLLLLTLLLGLGAAVWLLGRDYAVQYLQRTVREQLTKSSGLVLAPFTVELSPWSDFPHVTASLGHLSLTDTSHHRAVPVLRVGRANLRIELVDLWHRKVRVTRLEVHDADFRQYVDSTGHSWGLRGKKARRQGEGKDPLLNFSLDSIVVYNFHMVTKNDYAHSTLAGQVQRARLTGGIRQGALRLSGVLDGYLEQLANRSGTLLAHEPVRVWLNYRYAFKARRGEFWRTRATLNGDTIRIAGTHTVAADQPTGTMLHLQFAGTQPLVDVLHAALPPRLRPYLVGASSPSHARIVYTISGLSGPTVRPHTVLTFGLQNASLAWPDSARRINRWDLQGTYDNGPAHSLRTASVTLERCRIYSPVGQLDASFVLRNFLRPYVEGHLRGRTELPELATVISPGLWRAKKGIADLDIRLRGLIPPLGNQMLARTQKSLSVRGTVELRGATFSIPARRIAMSEVNVNIGLRDSLWRLTNASGTFDGMHFKAAATTTYLLTYLTGQHPRTEITGKFEVDELHIDRLRALGNAPTRRVLAAASAKRQGRRPRRNARKLAMTMGSHLLPDEVRLNVDLHCGRLILGPDTLRRLAVNLRHDGKQVNLSHIEARVWGGRLFGQASWPTDTTNDVAPVDFQLGIKFATLNYSKLISRLSRPPGAVAQRRKAALAARKPNAPAATPALRELLLAADGSLTWDIDKLVLPVGEPLRDLHLRFEKEDSLMRMPYLRFVAPQGGVGRASGAAIVAGIHLTAATANVDLRYASLDVQQLLSMLASLKPPRDTVKYQSRRVIMAARRARRLAHMRARNRKPSAPSPAGVLLASGGVTAVLRVQADRVHYNSIEGGKFQLVSHLSPGEARLDECSLDAFDGHITLNGLLRTDGGRQHHPLRIQALLEDIKLPDLFATTTAMGLQLLASDNVRGRLRCAAALRTDLDSTFLPVRTRTFGYVKADLRDLELLNVEALEQSFKFVKKERTGHLFFEPVSTEFLLNGGQILIPSLKLNSNLTELEVSGRYNLDGRANLYVGMNPLNVLFGNNKRRIERIQSGEPMRPRTPRLTYVNLRRDVPGAKYQVKLFQKKEQQQQQTALRQQYRQLLVTQRLDTTMRLLPRGRITGPVGTPAALPMP